MNDYSQPDFSFLTEDMPPLQQIKELKKAYVDLWDNGLRMLEEKNAEWQRQEQFGIKVIEHLRVQLQYYQRKYPNDKPPFANSNESEELIAQYEKMRSSNSNNGYNNNDENENDDNGNDSINKNDYLSVFANNPKHDSSKLKHELFLERRASEYLRQECDDLQSELQALQQREQEIVTVANEAWEKQLYSVFEQIAQQGHDIGSLKIDFENGNDSVPNDSNDINDTNNTMNDNNYNSNTNTQSDNNRLSNFGNSNGNNGNGNGNGNGNIGNLTGDPTTVSEVQGMRKNLVRLYTKTDWNQNELDELKEEMMQHMQIMSKAKINEMTTNDQIMAPQDNQYANQFETPINQLEMAQADAYKYKRLYDECEAKLAQLQQEYASKMLENEEGMKTLRDMLNEEKELLIQSKIDLVNSVSQEMQRLRDLIRLYNPEDKYKNLIEKIVRYHDLEPAKGNALFQLIENAELPVHTANKRRKSQIASAAVSNDDNDDDNDA